MGRGHPPPCFLVAVPAVRVYNQANINFIRAATSIGTVQVLNVKLGMNVEARDLELLTEKYINDDYGDMVNYVAFSSRVDPSEPAFDPYTLGA